jgi:hypothetical protein
LLVLPFRKSFAPLKERNARPMLWIDEADRMPLGTLTELRSLVEFDPAPAPLLSLVLSGPPELRIALDAPELFALKRRILVRAVLAGLRRDETEWTVWKRHSPGSARPRARSGATGSPVTASPCATAARPDAQRFAAGRIARPETTKRSPTGVFTEYSMWRPR